MLASPVHLHRLRAIPGDLYWLPLMFRMTKTELALFIVSKSQKVPFEGEEERVRAKRHSNNEWQRRGKFGLLQEGHFTHSLGSGRDGDL